MPRGKSQSRILPMRYEFHRIQALSWVRAVRSDWRPFYIRLPCILYDFAWKPILSNLLNSLPDSNELESNCLHSGEWKFAISSLPRAHIIVIICSDKTERNINLEINLEALVSFFVLGSPPKIHIVKIYAHKTTYLFDSLFSVGFHLNGELHLDIWLLSLWNWHPCFISSSTLDFIWSFQLDHAI